VNSDLLQSVEAVVRCSGDVAFGHYKSSLFVETKGDGSPVTVADREAELAARAWIEARYPTDGILGEEFDEKLGSSGRRWIIDPIDGTKSFVRGVPLWGALVALVEGERVLAGAAYFPAVGEMIVAAEGAGCWWNGQRARVSECSRIADATVLITDERTFGESPRRARWRELSDSAGISRTWGDCYGYLLVATGRADVMIDPVANAWDIACFQPIIEEAGGSFSDLDGNRSAFRGSAIASNATLARAARDYF
jgi:histidinol-phosphatase